METLMLLELFFTGLLFHSLEVSILAVLILLVKFVFKNKLQPRWHYIFWLLLLMKLLLPWTPQSSLSVFNLYQDMFEQQTITSIVQHKETNILDPRGKFLYPLTDPQPQQQEINSPILSSISLIWASGVLLFSFLVLWRYHQFSAQISKEPSIVDAELIDLFSNCQQSMGIKKKINLVESTEVATPAIWGFLSPKLLLPKNMLHKYNQSELKCIIIHELAHVKRKDPLVNGLMYMLNLMHWFNPILWYTYRRMREDQELACDALALQYLENDDHHTYAYTLIKMLEHNTTISFVTWSTNFFGYKYQIKRRIEMITSNKRNGYVFSNIGVGLVLALSLLTFTSPITEGSSVSTPTETSISVPTKFSIAPLSMPAEGRIVRDFTPQKAHQTGLAIVNTVGTPIYAVTDGTIIAAEYDRERGFYIIISHGFDLETHYAHLSEIGVEVGAEVQQGQPIGKMGSTGKSTGSHLHFAIFQEGRPIDFNLGTNSDGDPFIEF